MQDLLPREDRPAQDELFYVLQFSNIPPDTHVHVTPASDHLHLGLKSSLYQNTRL